MHTIYDIITIIMFAFLVVLFLQRSASQGPPEDKIYYYIPPALGCAGANWLGNQHEDLIAIATILAVIIYVLVVLRPFKLKS